MRQNVTSPLASSPSLMIRWRCGSNRKTVALLDSRGRTVSFEAFNLSPQQQARLQNPATFLPTNPLRRQ